MFFRSLGFYKISLFGWHNIWKLNFAVSFLDIEALSSHDDLALWKNLHLEYEFELLYRADCPLADWKLARTTDLRYVLRSRIQRLESRNSRHSLEGFAYDKWLLDISSYEPPFGLDSF